MGGRGLRKGQGIGLNVIIIAAIALLVLAVIAVLIFRAGNSLSLTCEEQGGQCYQKSDACPGGWGMTAAYTCEDERMKCCIKILS